MPYFLRFKFDLLLYVLYNSGMSIENPFNSSKQEQENNKIEQAKETIPVTSLDTYLDILNNNPPVQKSKEQFDKESLITRNKLDSFFQNQINDQLLKELSRNGLIEIIEDRPIENPLTIDELKLYLDESHTVRFITITNEDKENVTNRYYREKVGGLTTEEEKIKGEIANAYNALSNGSLYFKAMERSRQLDERVVAGDMVYIGEVTTYEYMDMMDKGLPWRFDPGFLVEVVDMYNSDETDPIGLKSKIYGRVK
jgi:hypothetical protein